MEYRGNSRSNSGGPQTQSGSPQTQSGPRGHRLSDQNPKGGRLTRGVGGLPPHQAGESLQNRDGEERSELRYPFAAIRTISSECRLDFARRRGVTTTRPFARIQSEGNLPLSVHHIRSCEQERIEQSVGARRRPVSLTKPQAGYCEEKGN